MQLHVFVTKENKYGSHMFYYAGMYKHIAENKE